MLFNDYLEILITVCVWKAIGNSIQ